MIQKAKCDQKLAKNGPKNAVEVVQKWSKNGPKMVQKWSKNAPNMVKKWFKNGPLLQIYYRCRVELVLCDPVGGAAWHCPSLLPVKNDKINFLKP